MAFVTRLSIAGVPLSIETSLPLPMEEAFLPFLNESEAPRYTARFREVDALPPHPRQLLLEENCYRVYGDGYGGTVRGFYNVGCPEDYALGVYDYPHGRIEIRYLRRGLPFLGELSNAFFHIGLEGLLIREDRACLHAALVDTPLGGLLFSGPSGIGKSTQAALWESWGGGRILNGDRPIVGRQAGRWYGWGSPYAGSSRYYVNEKAPLRAVFLLEQAPACRLEPLPVGEALRGIYRNLTVNQWDREASVRAFDLAAELAQEVPVYRFACTPDREAVRYLMNQLKDK